MARTSSDRREAYNTTIINAVLDMQALIRRAYDGYDGGSPKHVHDMISRWVWANPIYLKLPDRYKQEIRGYYMGYQNAKQNNGD